MQLAFSGEYEAAIQALDRAIRLSPRDPNLGTWLSQMAVAAFVVGQYQNGVDYGRQAVLSAPGFLGAHRALAANLAALNQLDDASREVAEMRRIMPRITVAITRASMPFREDEARERYCAALARAGLPD